MLLTEDVLNNRRSFHQPRIYSMLPWLILAIDLVGFFGSQLLATWFSNGIILDHLEPSWYLIFLLAVSFFYLFNTFHPELEPSGIRFFGRILLSGILMSVILITFIGLIGIGSFNRPFWQKESRLFLSLFFLTLWSASFRCWLCWQISKISRQGQWNIICGPDKIQDLASIFQDKHLKEANFTFFTHIGKAGLTPENSIYPIKSLTDTLNNFEIQACSGILVDPHFELSKKHLNELMKLRLLGTNIYSLPAFFEHVWLKVPPSSLRDDWFAFESGFVLLHNPLHIRVKRLTDLMIASILIVALAPLMVLSVIAIRLDSPGPIFYSQIRTGLNQKPFRVLKFRSMYQDAEARGAQWASQRDPRITRVGRLIRATRIDELPQLLNVLLGSMSMIGPRPERPEFDQKLAEQIPYYNIRYIVRPGITGWAQVLYPYGASIEDAYEKFSYDLYYLKNYSLFLDLRIVLKTIRVVLFGKGR